MSRSIHRLRRTVFGAAVLGCLGFGATQAIASPEIPANVGCNPTLCSAGCWAKGYYGGVCRETGCYCYRLEE